MEKPRRNWPWIVGRVLKAFLAVGLLALLFGGYVGSISEWYKGRPREDKDVVRMKQISILLVLGGGATSIGAAAGLYLVGKFDIGSDSGESPVQDT